METTWRHLDVSPEESVFHLYNPLCLCISTICTLEYLWWRLSLFAFFWGVIYRTHNLYKNGKISQHRFGAFNEKPALLKQHEPGSFKRKTVSHLIVPTLSFAAACFANASAFCLDDDTEWRKASDPLQLQGAEPCVHKGKGLVNVQRVLMCVRKKRKMALLGSSPPHYYQSWKLTLALTYGSNLEY